MKYKDRTKLFLARNKGLSMRILLAIVLVVMMRVTGLIGWAEEAGYWVVLESGMVNASDDQLPYDEDFDFKFTVKDLQNVKYPFEQFKGKVIFLNLWATWCGPCRAEMKGIQKLYDKVDKTKIVFVMLSIDRDSDRQKVIDYLKQKEFTFPVYLPSGYVPDQLKVPAIPTTFLISRQGKIVQTEVGSTKYNTPKFQKLLEDLSQ